MKSKVNVNRWLAEVCRFPCWMRIHVLKELTRLVQEGHPSRHGKEAEVSLRNDLVSTKCIEVSLGNNFGWTKYIEVTHFRSHFTSTTTLHPPITRDKTLERTLDFRVTRHVALWSHPRGIRVSSSNGPPLQVFISTTRWPPQTFNLSDSESWVLLPLPHLFSPAGRSYLTIITRDKSSIVC